MLIMHAKFHANMMLFIIQFKVHYGSIFIKDKEIEHLLVVVVFNLQLFWYLASNDKLIKSYNLMVASLNNDPMKSC